MPHRSLESFLFSPRCGSLSRSAMTMPGWRPARNSLRTVWLVISAVAMTGCSLIPDVRHRPQYHNPFPQLQTIAVLPFRNQSEEPTLQGSRVSLAYYNELQSIPGFEVLPVGAVEAAVAGFEGQVLQRPISSPEDLQQFARYLGVDAVVHGSITDFQAYYPPRMTLKVNWYAANEGFHPVPPGYGLPWGTKAEKKIPESIRLEAERALAREQMQSQIPQLVGQAGEVDSLELQAAAETLESEGGVGLASAAAASDERALSIEELHVAMPSTVIADTEEVVADENFEEDASNDLEAVGMAGLPFTPSNLPAVWPDPQGFIPPAPKVARPVARAQSLPIISHMKAYNGNDEDFTQRLSEYFYFRDEARFGGWEAYLQRSEDFIRFCCHLHLIETLAARGGQLESRTVVRWPIDRYQR
jgi:hypothetical protein